MKELGEISAHGALCCRTPSTLLAPLLAQQLLFVPPNIFTWILTHHCCAVLLCIETFRESHLNKKKDLPLNSLLFCQACTCLSQLKQTIVSAPCAEYKSALTPNEQMSAVTAAVNKLIGSKSFTITQTATLETEKHMLGLRLLPRQLEVKEQR